MASMDGKQVKVPDIHYSSTLLVVSIRQLISTILHLVSSNVITPSLAFDTSHLIVSPAFSTAFRWDAIHFSSIAKNGYEYEQQLAFMPSWPFLMRVGAEGLAKARTVVVNRLGVELPHDIGYSDVIIAGGMINILAAAAAAMFLYKLTRTLTGSHRFAFIATLFYALPPHPAAAVSAYTEPVFAYLTFQGFYFAVKKRWILAALSLALATSIRATGIFSVGILGWQILFGTALPSSSHFRPSYLLRRASLAFALCLNVIAPFVAFQAYAYASFCSDDATSRPWCSSAIPMPYSFVQAEYWNNGLFNYWTMEQVPNFLLAAPVLLVSILPTYSYFCRLLFRHTNVEPSRHPALLPFQILHTATTLLLVFASHTQIALRVALADPVVWWNIADMAFEWDPRFFSASPNGQAGSKQPVSVKGVQRGGVARRDAEIRGGRRMTKWGRLWVGYVVVWGLISLLLWAGHYPPA